MRRAPAPLILALTGVLLLGGCGDDAGVVEDLPTAGDVTGDTSVPTGDEVTGEPSVPPST